MKITVDVTGKDHYQVVMRLEAAVKIGLKVGRGAIAGPIGRFEGEIKDSKFKALKKLPGILAVEMI